MQIQEENLRDNLDAEFEEHKIKLESTEQPVEGDVIQPLHEIFESFGKIFGSNDRN